MRRAFLASLTALSTLFLGACDSCEEQAPKAPSAEAAPSGASSAAAAAKSPVGEAVPPDEEAAIAQATETIVATVKEAYRDAGTARRDAHAKAHGCVKARFTVPELPDSLRVGVFKEPKQYDAWVRYSNGNGTPQPDAVGDGRGMAIKLMGVPGRKLLAAEIDAQTQDFLMINYPVFFVDTAANYVTFEKELAGGDLVSYFVGVRNPETWHLRGLEIAKATVSQEVTTPLELHYYSMAAYLFGERAIKFSAKPCEPSQGIYKQTDSPSFMADNMEAALKEGSACFDFMVQLQTSPTDMPVEDVTKVWSEKASPFVSVAKIEIPSQAFRSEDQMRFCENLSFTPWHALPEHRPLGGINRLRKVVYETISTLRHDLNHAPRQEPHAGADFLPKPP